jgi:hypothetical protein
MKASVFVILLLLSLSSSSIVTKLGREFLSGFLQRVKGGDFVIKEGCLGAEFDTDIAQFVKSLSQANYLMAFSILHNVYQGIMENCPKAEIEKIFGDFEAVIKSNQLFGKIRAHYPELERTLKEEFTREHITAENIGNTLGDLVNTVLYDRSHNFLMFLDMTEDLKKVLAISYDEMSIFVDGFFEGVAGNPLSENKCKGEVKSVQKDIVNTFMQLFTAFKTRTGIIEAFTKLYEVTTGLKSLDANCNFTSLSLNVLSLSTKVGIAKLIGKVMWNISATYTETKSLYNNFSEGNYKDAGVAFGKLTTIGLGYSTK